MQAIGRLVEDEYPAALAETGSEFHALELPSGESRQGLIEMQVHKSDIHQGTQLLLYHRTGEIPGRRPHRHVHDLGDIVLPPDSVLQGLRRIAQAAAGLADRLHRIHEGHFGDYHPLAAADRTASLRVERKPVSTDLVLLGKYFPYVVGHSHIGRGRGAETGPDIFLTDVLYVILLRAAVHQALDQRAFARSGYSRHDRKHPEGKIHRDTLQIVQTGILHPNPSGRFQRSRVELPVRLQHTPRIRTARHQPLQRSLVHYPAPFHSGSRPHVHDVVGDADHLPVVLHEQDGIAVVPELADRVLQQGDIVVVQADTGLVENVEQVGQGGIDVFCDLAPLGLASGQGSHGPVQGQVA